MPWWRTDAVAPVRGAGRRYPSAVVVVGDDRALCGVIAAAALCCS